jgi:diguanylate cyclase (GGDEF)-like protein
VRQPQAALDADHGRRDPELEPTDAVGLEGPPLRLLLIEGDPGETDRIRAALGAAESTRFEIDHVPQVEDGLRRLHDGSYHAVLLDLTLPETDGIDSLARARNAAASVPIVVMTGDDEDMALRALRLGAQDYLVKERPDDRLLVRTLRDAVERHRILLELNRARQREHYLATHDSLTDLPNRWSFHDHLTRALTFSARNAKQLAVLFLDLDRFKSINDTLGHPVGDELLKLVAERLSEPLRRSDMVARVGGDEFVIMLQDLHHDHNPVKVVRRILDAFSEPYVLEGREYRVTVAIGIALFPGDGTDADILIRNADTAMYHAKANGLNQYNFYCESMNAAAVKKLELENGLHQAIDRDQFVFVYQPQIDVVSRRMAGVEALVRWSHPQRGLLSPDEFIATAEDMHVIDVIGERALLSACSDASRWTVPDGQHVSVSVNVSAQQLDSQRFADVVARILDRTGVAADRLELEITESGIMEGSENARENLVALRRMGVRIAIDDFGRGYSSMTVLKELPIDTIKIDRSFIGGLGSDRADEAICTALISMAQGLGLEIVAEGVDSREQMEFLLEHGCWRMQGYLFERPVPSDEIARQLVAEKPEWAEVLRDTDR